MSQKAVVGRLAPSPTGSLHLGHAFSFLAAWWSARAAGGKVVLRMEDVDAGRASEEHIAATLFDLNWLGIDWDGPPVIQSTRSASLRSAAERLLALGLGYPCTCTRKDLAEAHSVEEEGGAPQAGSVQARYPGTCRGRFEQLEQAETLTGKEAGLRFRVPPGSVEFEDAVYGHQAIDVDAEVGDFQILRRDKTPAYQLAVVVDDAADQVTEVIRGRDLLESTARQILLARALGLDSPGYLHVPLICDHTGRRLAKRENSLSLAELRRQGASASQIVAWAARSLGQPETLTGHGATQALDAFDPLAIGREDVLLPRAIRDAL